MSLKSLEADILEILCPTASQSAAKSRASSARRILVVNDEEDTRQYYCEVLAQSGYSVDAAIDGDEGWQMLQAAKDNLCGYDLLITDNNMPKVSGLEMIRTLRSAGMTLPVIMATSAVPPNIEGLQIAAILEKPFYVRQLLQAVKDIL